MTNYGIVIRGYAVFALVRASVLSVLDACIHIPQRCGSYEASAVATCFFETHKVGDKFIGNRGSKFLDICVCFTLFTNANTVDVVLFCASILFHVTHCSHVINIDIDGLMS